ncbi:hypothetical protein [Litoreibacter ascidiaceicola]|nr:hypothetical protein [Litoreibacter ascidiaceicola]
MMARLRTEMPVLTDAQLTHQLSFDIGTAEMTDEITPAVMA